MRERPWQGEWLTTASDVSHSGGTSIASGRCGWLSTCFLIYLAPPGSSLWHCGWGRYNPSLRLGCSSLSHIWLSAIPWTAACQITDFHCLPEFAQTHVHRVSVSIQPSYLLSSPSSAFNLSQHQGLFQWVSSLHQVAKVLELQPQHQFFQWISRVDFL